jgi:PadR family transcriptional regulator, regulatory protein PadR
MPDALAREFLLAFWKIHVLHHASQRGGIYGRWMLQELRHYAYELSPGTLYPLLSRMEARGWLRATAPDAPKARRVYRLTATGRRVLRELARFVDELTRKSCSIKSWLDSIPVSVATVWANDVLCAKCGD